MRRRRISQKKADAPEAVSRQSAARRPNSLEGLLNKRFEAAGANRTTVASILRPLLLPMAVERKVGIPERAYCSTARAAKRGTQRRRAGNRT
jgi:hypothetical protein